MSVVRNARPTDETARHTFDELEHYAQAIDACRRASEHLPQFNYRL
ncbi:MAG: hypothetical protein IBJ12_12710 [Sphingomonadaceae bacterium]|nr:hypothetical protein [Sphingomonadaceae bacterium]